MDLTLQAEEVAMGGSFPVGEVGIIIIFIISQMPVPFPFIIFLQNWDL